MTQIKRETNKFTIKEVKNESNEKHSAHAKFKEGSSYLSRSTSTRNSYNRRLITFTDDISDCFTVRITDYQ